MNKITSPTKKARKSTYQRGEDTTKSIVLAAKIVFMNQGYASLSIRKVALEAGISVGNLTYHFPNKQSLIEAMFDHIISEYLVAFDYELTNLGSTPKEKLERIIEFIYRDLLNPSTTVLFPELWALANHESYASRIVEQVYERARSAFKALIPQINSDLTPQECQDIALFMSASIEGHTMFVGANKQFTQSIERLIKIAQLSFIQLIERKSDYRNS